MTAKPSGPEITTEEVAALSNETAAGSPETVITFMNELYSREIPTRIEEAILEYRDELLDVRAGLIPPTDRALEFWRKADRRSKNRHRS